MSDAYRCDRCGGFYIHHQYEAEMKIEKKLRKFTFNTVALRTTDSDRMAFERETFDLCPSCCGALVKFLTLTEDEG